MKEIRDFYKSKGQDKYQSWDCNARNKEKCPGIDNDDYRVLYRDEKDNYMLCETCYERFKVNWIITLNHS